jgi:hypothetical protein
MLSNIELVRKVLEKFPDTRDCDKKLVWYCYEEILGVTIEKIYYKEFVEKLPHFESLRRARQHLQQFYPELRGLKYKDRHKKKEVVKKEVIDKKWEAIKDINEKRVKHSEIYEVIKSSDRLSKEDKELALADIRRMETDVKYAQKVNFDCETNGVDSAFFWYKSDLGSNFWIKINEIIN